MAQARSQEDRHGNAVSRNADLLTVPTNLGRRPAFRGSQPLRARDSSLRNLDSSSSSKSVRLFKNLFEGCGELIEFLRTALRKLFEAHVHYCENDGGLIREDLFQYGFRLRKVGFVVFRSCFGHTGKGSTSTIRPGRELSTCAV